MAQWSVVVPTVRPDEFVRFMEAWGDDFKGKHLIIIEDAPEVSEKVAEALQGFDHEHLCQADVPDFIPIKTDMIRSWGFYRAWKTNCDYVATLDDDVRPGASVFESYEVQFLKGAHLSPYLSVGALTTAGVEMRGFPYRDRGWVEVGVQYGGWNGVLDYDAATQLSFPQSEQKFRDMSITVPKGIPTTCCIMNAAFRRELTPIMWQLPMLDGRYNRIGDIWSGLFIKKHLDHIGQAMVINGNASVLHKRASNPYNSLVKEAPSVEMNDEIWDALADGDYRTVTLSARKFFLRHDPEYAEHFANRLDQWLGLFGAH